MCIYSKVLCMQKQKFVFKREQLHECCEGERIWNNEYMCVGVATPRYLSPRCMRSKALLISASGMVCVTNSSTFSCPARYSSTSLGTLSRLFQPGAGRGGEGRGGQGGQGGIAQQSPITDGWCITSKSRSLPYTSSHQLEGPSGDFCRGW